MNGLRRLGDWRGNYKTCPLNILFKQRASGLFLNKGKFCKADENYSMKTIIIDVESEGKMQEFLKTLSELSCVKRIGTPKNDIEFINELAKTRETFPRDYYDTSSPFFLTILS